LIFSPAVVIDHFCRGSVDALSVLGGLFFLFSSRREACRGPLRCFFILSRRNNEHKRINSELICNQASELAEFP